MIHYLCGPMSNVPAFNIPTFEAAAEALRKEGYVVISPAELDDPETRELCRASPDGSKHVLGHTWGYYMGRDIAIVADRVGGIILLPGWEKSRGAKLEAYTGLLCGHEFRLYSGHGLAFKVPEFYVRGNL